jgi:hypothetical protein
MGGFGSGRTGGRPTYESTASVVLRMSSFAKAKLRFGLKGVVDLRYNCRGDPLEVSIVINTLDQDCPYFGFKHRRRTAGADLEGSCPDGWCS